MSEHEEITIETGSGNVFADLGFENAEEMLAKSRLISRLDSIRQERGLSQAEFGKLIAMPQSEVSKMLRGKLDLFTIERLMKALRDVGEKPKLEVVFLAAQSDTAAQAS